MSITAYRCDECKKICTGTRYGIPSDVWSIPPYRHVCEDCHTKSGIPAEDTT